MALYCVGGCREATEIRLEMATDIPACSNVNLTAIAAGRPGDVGQRAFSAETDKCAPSNGEIGSLVLVPSEGDGDAVGVQAITALGQMTPASCRDSGFKVAPGQIGGCIVQRRQLRFVPHKRLTLPITMDIDCVDVPCDEKTTCRNGACVPRDVPNPEECALPGGCGSGGFGGAGGAGGTGGAGGVSVVAPSYALALGQKHSCVVTETGAVRCWGDNSSGQLGYDDTNQREVPGQDLVLGASVVRLVAGRQHNCALLSDGRVQCWGGNTFGQLGYGHTSPVGGVFNLNFTKMPPEDVNVGAPVAELAAGGTHTCALLTTGAVRCWGNNTFGQLGYGDTEHRGGQPSDWPLADVNVGGTVVQIAAGLDHTCALLESGDVRCWGGNDVGQLGYGDTERRGDEAGESLATNVPVGGRVRQLALGEFHTCALLESGAVRCWGGNSFGELGYGHIDPLGNNPNELPTEDLAVGGLVAQLTVGLAHTCALLSSGAVRCWGSSSGGQLGYGSTNYLGDEPGEMGAMLGSVPLDGQTSQIRAGSSHTCALLTGGTIQCWGFNNAGQLGYGHTNHVGDQPGEMPPPDVNVGAKVLPLP